nr:hypothetical protein [Tanacetum cinerariifolium]
MPTARHVLSSAAIEQLIVQRVADAIAAYESNRSTGNGIQNKASEVEHTAHGCSYKEFFNCKPRKFNGTKGVVGLTRWFVKMEIVFHICNCAENCQLKYATCRFQ